MAPSPHTRVYLRTPRLRDADRFLTFAREYGQGLEPWVYLYPSRDTYRAYVRSCEAPDREGFLLMRHDDDVLLGVVNVNVIIRGAMQSAAVGYYLGQPYQGHGYMKEGLALVLDECFDRLRLHRVEANIQPPNDRSKQLVRRLGFRYEGLSPKYLKINHVWCDHERWAILEEEWACVRGDHLPAHQT